MGISQHQQDFIDAILARYTEKEAAEHAGVDLRTVWRWRHDPVFAEELAGERRRLRDATIGQLQQGGPDAARRLTSLVDSADPKIAGKAATDLLRWFFKGIETEDVLERVKRLSERVDQLDGNGLSTNPELGEAAKDEGAPPPTPPDEVPP